MGNRDQSGPELIRRLSLYLVSLLIWANAAIAGCHLNSVELRGPWEQARFSVELVDTAETRARGLMFRETLPTSSGMLFVYPHPGPAGFWMKNTLIPLDMLFIAADGTVESIHHDAIPHDLTPIDSLGSVKMVLEINGGLARRMGLTPGSQMRHPLLDQTGAIWPCSAK